MLSTYYKLLVVLVGLQGRFCEYFSQTGEHPPEAGLFNGSVYASCKMSPSTKLPQGQPKVYGYVLFKQQYPEGTLQLMINLHGFPTADQQPRAIHIHQYGDLSEGCDSTGGHYNPYAAPHPGHPGDFGNFQPRQGKLWAQMATKATLFGGLSALGRAMVLHEKEDDLGLGGDAGSLLHGNAGRRLACCVIGVSTPKLWEPTRRRLLSRI